MFALRRTRAIDPFAYDWFRSSFAGLFGALDMDVDAVLKRSQPTLKGERAGLARDLAADGNLESVRRKLACKLLDRLEELMRSDAPDGVDALVAGGKARLLGYYPRIFFGWAPAFARFAEPDAKDLHGAILPHAYFFLSEVLVQARGEPKYRRACTELISFRAAIELAEVTRDAIRDTLSEPE